MPALMEGKSEAYTFSGPDTHARLLGLRCRARGHRWEGGTLYSMGDYVPTLPSSRVEREERASTSTAPSYRLLPR
jgi:hypothetical protein